MGSLETEWRSAESWIFIHYRMSKKQYKNRKQGKRK